MTGVPGQREVKLEITNEGSSSIYFAYGRAWDNSTWVNGTTVKLSTL